VLPISDPFNEYGTSVRDALHKAGLRVELDDRSESIGRKIREAELRKIPHMLIVGEREAEEGTVSVREHGKGDTGSVSSEDLTRRLQGEIERREARADA
jgi:threonyl-tRNA synthetase